MSSSKTYDYLILLVVALSAYMLATVGTHQMNKASISSSSSSSTDSLNDALVLGPRSDKATGIRFAETQDFSTAKKMTLVGIGTRKKAILNIYSLGVYVSKPLLKEFPKGRCGAILDSKSPKAVQLTFAMGIGPEKIAEAVSGLKGVDPAILKEFHDMLVNGLGGQMRKGESMSFEWKGLDTISVTARGIRLGTMKNKDLARGVLSLYVGPQSVAPSLLQDLKCR